MRGWSGLGLAVALSCAPPRQVAVADPCESDDDCAEGDVCDPEKGCVPADPNPWDELEGVQHWEDQRPNPNVDLLFVLDNSSSMGPMQAKLAANFGAFMETIEADDVGLSYRVAFTTTDVGNPTCDGTTPENGAFGLSSCRGRLDEFVDDQFEPPLDTSDIGCTDICQYEAAQLDARMKPTTTALDPSPRVRPWIENIDWVSNLPGDVSTVQAINCFGPQGIAGCDMESPLEAMYRALARTFDENDPAYGFSRDEASLFVLIVTDEADCSLGPDGAEIFGPDNHVFWSDPDASAPTDAVCWNAGTECDGGPGTYESCRAVDKDLDGALTEPGQAVLHPLSRYVDLLQGFADQKQALGWPESEVVVSVLTGVPEGYSTGMSEITYADSPDPGFQTQYGIGPGCTNPDENLAALPPVRLREWAEHFGDRNLYSLCSDDYTPVLEGIAERLAAQQRPLCYHHCAAESLSCQVWQTSKAEDPEVVPACIPQEGVFEVPDGANVCFLLATDAEQTDDPLDDMDDECVEDGSNVQLKILRREGHPALWPTRMTMACALCPA